jgi:hypothetical protein
MRAGHLVDDLLDGHAPRLDLGVPVPVGRYDCRGVVLVVVNVAVVGNRRVADLAVAAAAAAAIAADRWNCRVAPACGRRSSAEEMARVLFVAATMVVDTLKTASASASVSNTALKLKRRRASREEPDGVVGDANIVAFASAE